MNQRRNSRFVAAEQEAERFLFVHISYLSLRVFGSTRGYSVSELSARATAIAVRESCEQRVFKRYDNTGGSTVG
jgi:hypothetical protein